MARPIRTAVALGLLVLVALALAPRGPRVASVLGDGAPDLRATMGTVPAPSGPVTALEVALLRRPANLRHLPEARTLCRDDCDAALTRIVELRPGGWRKMLVIDLDRFAGSAALDRGGGLPEPTVTCLAQAVRAEAAALAPEGPDCLPGLSAAWRLPWGL